MKSNINEVFFKVECPNYHFYMGAHLCSNPNLIWEGRSINSVEEIRSTFTQDGWPLLFTCPPCGYSSKDGVLCDRNHRVVVYSEATSKQLVCTECLRKFSDLNTLILHMHWSHGVDCAFPCGVCTNVYNM